MKTECTPIAFSGRIPENYDQYLGPMFFQPFALDMAARVKQIAPQSVLEIAAGTGRVTALLPESLPRGAAVLATDINPAMVEYGKTKAQHHSLQWQVADAVDLSFEDEQFDCVAVQFGVMFYSDKQKAFREAFRVLKPGGTFIFNAWDKIVNNPMPMIANTTLAHFFPENTPAFYSVPFSYYDEQLIQSDLRSAGFNDLRMELLQKKGTAISASAAAKGLIEGTPTVTAIEERDKTVLPTLLGHLEKMIIEKFGTGVFEVPLCARVITVKK